MQGFVKGLESQYGVVRNSLAGLTDDIAKPATIGLDSKINVSPARGGNARTGKMDSTRAFGH